jgi:hypothetical protein
MIGEKVSPLILQESTRHVEIPFILRWGLHCKTIFCIAFINGLKLHYSLHQKRALHSSHFLSPDL